MLLQRSKRKKMKLVKAKMVRPQLPKRRGRKIERKTRTSKEITPLRVLKTLMTWGKLLGVNSIQVAFQRMTALAPTGLRGFNLATFRSHQATKGTCLIEAAAPAKRARITRKFGTMIWSTLH